MKDSTALTMLDGRAHSEATKMAYADWLAQPTQLRTPATHRDWAGENGVSEVTLWRWRRQPEFRQQMAERIRGWFLEEMPDVVKALVDKAKEGNVKAAELLLRHIGEVWNFGGEEVESAERERGMQFFKLCSLASLRRS